MTYMPDMSLKSRLPVTKQIMSEFDMRFPHASEMTNLHDTFQPMINAPITSDAQVAAIQARTGQCVFVLEDKNRELAGSMLLIQLSKAGLDYLMSGKQLGHVIKPEWISPPSLPPCGLLVWGLLGRNPWYSGRVLLFSLALARKVYADMPILTYAATPGGAYIMERVGFLPADVPGLYQLDLSIRNGDRHAKT